MCIWKQQWGYCRVVAAEHLPWGSGTQFCSSRWWRTSWSGLGVAATMSGAQFSLGFIMISQVLLLIPFQGEASLRCLIPPCHTASPRRAGPQLETSTTPHCLPAAPLWAGGLSPARSAVPSPPPPLPEARVVHSLTHALMHSFIPVPPVMMCPLGDRHARDVAGKQIQSLPYTF